MCDGQDSDVAVAVLRQARCDSDVMCQVPPNQLKRKRTSSWSDVIADDDKDSGVSSSQIVDAEQRLRRRVLELSLAKVRTAAPLSRWMRRREPPLLRSVLILNTLRAVDSTGTFSDVDPTLSAGGPVVAPATPYRSLDELPGSLLVDDGRPLATPSLTDDLAHCDALTEVHPADDVISHSILDDLFGCERTSGSSTSPPVLTFSSLFDLDCASVWPSMSLSSSTSMDVDLGLDVTMFDFDLLQPLTTSRTSASNPAAPAGVAGGVLATSAYTQRSQIFVDELERIAQILVGT